MERKTTTSTVVKARYNGKTYKYFRFPIRKDSQLYNDILNFKRENPQGLSNLIKTLLEAHFNTT